ncbi:MAG: flavin reductase family protein [Candidatus Latescibacteria bacterium]|nr:flavin reductase family protein [Candidatus Latescibacterota bacterium]
MQVETPFNEAILRKYPEQVVIALAKEKSGKVNPITLGWTMLTSHKPPMMAVSVGLTRYSLEVIRQAGEFVIAFPSELQVKDTLLFGTKSGRNVNKIEESGIAVSPAQAVDCLVLDDAVANFECRLAGELQTGDHVVFVGEVLKAHVNPDAPGRLYTVAKGYRMSGITVRSS